MTAENDAIRILDTHRTMAISTLRPDGWSQTTLVGYANVGLTIYFLIFRSSQKFENIQRDNRISIAVGEEPRDVRELNAVYAGAHVSEVTDASEREDAWRLLMQRHANLANFDLPDPSDAAMMQAVCKYVSLLDYTVAPGYRRTFTSDTGGSAAAQVDGPGLGRPRSGQDYASELSAGLEGSIIDPTVDQSNRVDSRQKILDRRRVPCASPRGTKVALVERRRELAKRLVPLGAKLLNNWEQIGRVPISCITNRV